MTVARDDEVRGRKERWYSKLAGPNNSGKASNKASRLTVVFETGRPKQLRHGEQRNMKAVVSCKTTPEGSLKAAH